MSWFFPFFLILFIFSQASYGENWKHFLIEHEERKRIEEKTAREEAARITEEKKKVKAEGWLRKEISKDSIFFVPVYITERYRQGSFLIYDCEERAFICVDDVSFEDCSIAREKARLTYMRRVLPCAPLREFPSITACVKVLYEKMYEMSNKSFCMVKY